MKTQAVVFTAPSRVEVQTLEVPAPGPGEVLIRTRLSGISAGTEGWILRNEFSWSPTPYPCVPGYQRTGEVVATGDGVSDFKPGDRVVATVGSWHGGPESFWGAHLALASTPEEFLYHLPAAIDDADGAHCVVAQVGWNAAHRPPVEPGEWAVVYGDGLIGQSGAQALRARGARVLLVGHRAARLQLAREHSADAVLNNREQSLAEKWRELAGEEPLRLVIDTIQTLASQREYHPLLPPLGGHVVYSGFTPGPSWADTGLLQQKEVTAHFVAGFKRPRMEATLAHFAAGTMGVRALTTHCVNALAAPRLYDMIINKNEPFLGLTMDWTGENLCEY